MTRDPETGPHTRVDALAEERESSRWAWWLGVVCAVAFLSVAVVGSVVVIRGADSTGASSSELTSSRPTESAVPSAEPSERETLEATEATSPDAEEEAEPEPTGRIARTPEEVLAKTKYVQRYRDGIPDISRKHPDIGKNGLANHGATICGMIADRKTSIFDLVRVFMLEFHAHPGPVTEQKALLATDMAVQEICPDLADEWRQKQDI